MNSEPTVVHHNGDSPTTVEESSNISENMAEIMKRLLKLEIAVQEKSDRIQQLETIVEQQQEHSKQQTEEFRQLLSDQEEAFHKRLQQVGYYAT